MTTRTELQHLQRDWRPPDGLDRSRPREVRLTGGGRVLVGLSFLLWVAGVVVAAGLQAQRGRETAELALLRSEGVVTEAEVTRLWRGRGDDKPTYVAYRFGAGGTRLEGSRRVPRGFWSRLHVGDSLPVRYAPSRPELNHPAPLEPRPTPQGIPVVVAVMFGLLGGVCWLPILGQRRLLAEGRAARAVVTAHKKMGQHGKALVYEFATLGGTVATGKSGPQRKPQAIGTTLCVLYDPEKPSSNAVYPLALVRPFWGALR
jgi:hypothetical protein